MRWIKNVCSVVHMELIAKGLICQFKFEFIRRYVSHTSSLSGVGLLFASDYALVARCFTYFELSLIGLHMMLPYLAGGSQHDPFLR